MVAVALCIFATILSVIFNLSALGQSQPQALNTDRKALRLVVDDLDKHYPRFPVTHREPVGTPLFELGKELFFSKSLSGSNDVACASCHHPLLAGGDSLSLPVGESAYDADLIGPGRWHDWQASADPNANGAPNVARHSQTTFNTSLYNRALFYDGRIFVLDSEIRAAGQGQKHRTPDSNLWQGDITPGHNLLSTQARFPVVSNDEMLGFDFAHNKTNSEIRNAIVERIKTDDIEDKWLTLFENAFQELKSKGDSAIQFANIETALANYQSTQVFIENDWFAYLDGNESKLTDEQVQGALLFLRPVEKGGAGCINCHVPPTFTDEQFHNIAVPQFGRGKQPDSQDFGRRNVSQKDKDRYAFRTPSLLNVSATAPYTHTGAFYDLSSVISHHIDPTGSLDSFDFSFADNPQMRHAAHLLKASKQNSQNALADLVVRQSNGQSKLQSNINITADDINALGEYLKSLTDPCVKNEECLSAWVPDSNTKAPDGSRLVAKFSQHKSPPESLDTIAEPLLEKEQFKAAQKPVIISAELTEATKLGCSSTRRVSTNNFEGFAFSEIGIASGLTRKHHISWPLYNLHSAQRILFSGGVAAGDINGDCYADIFYPTGDTTPDVLYINARDGSFSDESKQWGIEAKELSNGVAIIDIDGDQDLDIITSNLIHPRLTSIGTNTDLVHKGESPTLYVNRNKTSFDVHRNNGIEAKFTSWSFAFGDYDNDGDIDALSTHWRGPGLGGEQPNHIWQNISDGDNIKFVAADAKANLMELVGNTDFTFTGNFADINNDGNLDLLMAADFESSQVYKNLGTGSFTKVTQDSEINDKNGMGAAIIDYDNDGDLDWFVSSVWDPNGIAEGNWGTIGNRLYNNNNGHFKDVTNEAGVAKGLWAWGACFADFNNDQWPDLFHVNGFDMDKELYKHLGNPYAYIKLKRSLSEFEKTSSRLFISNQNGTFKERSQDWGITDTLSGRAAVCFDYDRDGDVDILISNHQNRLLLYSNNASQNHNANFINITLSGADRNSQAIGAKVYVTANGITQMQEVRGGGGFISSSPTDLHFGLSSAKSVDEIRVVWPGPEQRTSKFEHIAANDFYNIRLPKDHNDTSNNPLQLTATESSLGKIEPSNSTP